MKKKSVILDNFSSSFYVLLKKKAESGPDLPYINREKMHICSVSIGVLYPGIKLYEHIQKGFSC
jgi:hypothetical protein